MEKIRVTESFCCTAGINVVKQLYSNKKKELSNDGEFVYPGGTEGFAVGDSSLTRERKDD